MTHESEDDKDALGVLVSHTPPAYANLQELFELLSDQGVVGVGEAGIGVQGEGESLPPGEQCIVNFFESAQFLNQDDVPEHPPMSYMGAPQEYATIWGQAESARLAAALQAIDDTIGDKGCACP